MKKTAWILAAVILMAALLTACGSDAPASAPGGEEKTSSASVPSADPGKETVPTSRPAGSGSQAESTSAEAGSAFKSLNSEKLLAWGKAFSEDAELYWGELKEDLMSEEGFRLVGTYTEGKKELCSLLVMLNGRTGDEAAEKEFLMQAIEWLEEKLGADFARAKRVLENGEQKNGTLRV